LLSVVYVPPCFCTSATVVNKSDSGISQGFRLSNKSCSR